MFSGFGFPAPCLSSGSFPFWFLFNLFCFRDGFSGSVCFSRLAAWNQLRVKRQGSLGPFVWGCASFRKGSDTKLLNKSCLTAFGAFIWRQSSLPRRVHIAPSPRSAFLLGYMLFPYRLQRGTLSYFRFRNHIISLFTVEYVNDFM